MKRHSGITLIELLVVVTIIGILAAVAVPGYRNQVLRSNRVEAKTALQRATQVLERCYTRTRTYATCVVQLGMTERNLYNITIERAVTTYTLTATATTPGQSKDTGCTVLTLNQAGQRMPPVSDPNKCW